METIADAGVKVLRGLLDVFLLESLERAPKHGYALLREMADAFGTEPNRNRLYPLLGRMVRDGLIAERNDAEGSRTLYVLTEGGASALAQYRALPAPFHERLARIWSSVTASVAVQPAPRAPLVAPVTAPRPAVGIPASGAPYPCVDARVSLEKDARSGDLAIKLTGCPMGAYDYCPLCPVSKAVEGLRRITFG